MAEEPNHNSIDFSGAGPTGEQARLATAVENAAEAIIITDFDGIIQYVNPAFESIAGYPRSEIIDRHISLLDSGKQGPAFFQDMWQTLREGEVWKGHFVNKKKDGSLYETEATISPVRGQDGAITNFVSVQRDVTHEVELQKQLRQAQKMEAIGTLAGGIAHDFNNLLMGIQGNVSLSISEPDITAPLLENLQKIEQYVQDGVKLTKQLLGFARGGKYEVHLTDLNQLLEDQSLLFSRANKHISFEMNYAASLWSVEADKGQLEQVILNLYMNALQAMPREGTLTVRTANVTIDKDRFQPYRVKAGRYVKFTITDTGIGMDEKTQHRIFDPFFTTREKGRGTGLGLASVYGIVKNHDGYIDVSSSEGQGTSFEVYFPATDKVVAPQDKSGESPAGAVETVLLVDDEEMIIDVGTRMLTRLGYEVLTAANGVEAVETYRANQDRIDFVLLDMVMPKVGGGEVFDRIRAINPAVKVILCSGYSIDGQATDILKRGCNAFIQKPFNLKSLSNQIRAVLDEP
ncbi:diguanylate cyclase/phosphodiesterase (GGDEF & EAL domains) with PAS/PAC sensor(s) [Olavius algarvensis Delta 1 endosymbiont]|nr:diguanylate cyclase/phosphodiesterase (GGDEF & EAL domains) with PAS/PAC sensor(s) [Olavius algarvensis Delta 1 endosymbiont]